MPVCVLIFIRFCGVFKDALCTSVSEALTDLVTMNNVLKAVLVCFKELFQHLLDGLRKTKQNARLAGVLQ
jgi:hypothetical protein